MSNITPIDAYRNEPHLTIQDPVTEQVSVLPLSMVRDIANGKLELTDCDDWEEVNRGLMRWIVDFVEEAEKYL